jgi:hypothetical protein
VLCCHIWIYSYSTVKSKLLLCIHWPASSMPFIRNPAMKMEPPMFEIMFNNKQFFSSYLSTNKIWAIVRLETPWGSLWFIHSIVKFLQIIFHKSVFMVKYHLLRHASAAERTGEVYDWHPGWKFVDRCDLNRVGWYLPWYLPTNSGIFTLLILCIVLYSVHYPTNVLY